MKMVWTGTGALLGMLLALAGCEQSHTHDSSGSNWLSCETLAECSAAEQATSCDAAGFCTDARGERIRAGVPESDASTLPVGRIRADAGAGAPGADASMIMLVPSNDAAVASGCAWGADALLQQVGAAAPDRVSCGSYSGGQRDALVAAMSCFDDLIASERVVELTINRCIDCTIATTYVATVEGDLFAILMEEDHFGDPDRHARVERCAEIAFDVEVGDVVCEGATELYTCSEPLAVARALPEPPPRVPLKVGEVPAGGLPTVPLHLYVSNQSFARAQVDIAVSIAGALVVTGDFDVGSQHSWFNFDLAVPAGAFAVTARSMEGDADFEQMIDVPAERWLVLEYWYDPEAPDAQPFTLSLHTAPVGFD